MTTPLFRVGFWSILWLGAAQGEDVFRVTGSNPTDQVQVGGSSFPVIFEDAIRARGAFSSLSGTDANYVLRYGGVDNAMVFAVNAGETQATLGIPITGFQRTFVGAGRDDLETQMEDFLKNEGAGVFRDFLAAIAARSMVAVTDGNPQAATAVQATGTFMDHAFDAGGSTPPEDRPAEGQPSDYRLARDYSLYPEFAVINAGPFTGTAWGLDVPAVRTDLGDGGRWDLAIKVPLRYREIEGAQSGSGGINFALPFQAILPRWSKEHSLLPTGRGEVLYLEREDGWAWRVTPSVGVLAAGSVDFADASLMTSQAVSSALEWLRGDLSLTLGNHVTFVQAGNFEVDGYPVGGQINQQILKNGVQAAWTPDPRHTVRAYGIYSQFLESAAVPDYWTLGMEYVFRNNLYRQEAQERDPFLSVRGYADVADKDYTAVGVRLGAGFTF